MSFIASGALIATAAIAVGTAVYTGKQQRAALGKQQDALKAKQEADAREKVEAETGAAVAANAQVATAKRRRRDSALALGAPTGSNDTLGAPSVATQPATVLGSAAR